MASLTLVTDDEPRAVTLRSMTSAANLRAWR